jgi:hypothetical protein
MYYESLSNEKNIPYEALDTPATVFEDAPIEPEIVIVDYNPKDVLIYIQEQCRIADVDHGFAVSLLQEENPTFFRLLIEDIPSERAFEAKNYNKNGSVDLGLWQLNDNYLRADFVPNYWHGDADFDWKNPYHNTYVAIRHIRWLFCAVQKHHLDEGVIQFINSVYWETALAYNTGISNVKNATIPSSTLDYAARIVERSFF